MTAKNEWDWNIGKRVVADIAAIGSQYNDIHEMQASPDGETLAILAKTEDDEFTISLNDKAWEKAYEKLWYLKYMPNGKLLVLAMDDDEWAVAVDGELPEELFEFAWNPIFSADGQSFAYMYKLGINFGISLNGEMMDGGFANMRDFCISPDGKHFASTVQIAPRKEADVEAFFKGLWSVQHDSKAWESKLVGCWTPIFNHDSSKVAAQIRVANDKYTIGVDGVAWEQLFPCVWEPSFRPNSDSVVASVRVDGNWTLAEDGEFIWDRRYAQLWKQRFSPDGSRIAAAAAEVFGKWTITVDDQPWKRTFGDMVSAPIFSADGSKIAAIVKEKNKWGIAVDGEVYSETFEMIWDPVLSQNGRLVAVKAERNGKFFLLLNGKISGGYEKMWDPVFSDDDKKLMLRYVFEDKYYREVIDVA